MAVTVQPRDVTFSFPNSCNSRCCQPSEVRELYVNSEGHLEGYKARKAVQGIDEAFNRSLSHLNATLERKVTSFQGNPEEFQVRVSGILESIYALKEVNDRHIEVINELMVEYLREKSPKSVRFEVRDPSENELEPSKWCLIL